MKEQVIERLIRYAKIDTQSDFTSETTPSTQKQFNLLHVLKEELAAIGLTDITLDDNGYLFATLEANTDKVVPTIGFLAHVDTATDFTGTNVNPQRIDHYDGGDIQLNENLIMSPTEFPELKNYVGQTLITTDGTTLLGADDKAGIAEIMTEVLLRNIAFPDPIALAGLGIIIVGMLLHSYYTMVLEKKNVAQHTSPSEQSS
ncbi:Peptidase T [Lysinibacillus sphaericus]